MLCKFKNSEELGIALISKKAYDESVFAKVIETGDVSALLDSSALFFRNNVYHKLRLAFTDASA